MNDDQPTANSIQGLQADVAYMGDNLTEMLNGIRDELISLNGHLATLREESQAALKVSEDKRCRRIVQMIQRAPRRMLTPETLSGGNPASELFLDATERLESEGQIVWLRGSLGLDDEDTTGSWMLGENAKAV